jgi:ADP-ribose pyrophosphatase YjhB (NUDIX family)
LQKRDKQPYINSWTLPYGKLHIEDATLEAAARREASDKLGFTPDNIRHAGDCYIRVTSNGELLSTTLAHVFRFEHDDIVARDDLQWVRPHKLNQYKLAPAVEAIVARSFFNDQFFFEEFDTVW